MLNKFLFVVLLTLLIVLSVYALYQRDEATRCKKALQAAHEVELNYEIERERQYSLAIELRRENDALKQRLKRCR